MHLLIMIDYMLFMTLLIIFNRNEETSQYKYAIIEFYINNVGYIGTNAFFLYYGNYLEPNNFMFEKYAEEYSILKIRYILN